MTSLILPAIGAFAAIVFVAYYQHRVIAKKSRQNHELRRKNNALLQELNHAKTRKKIEQTTASISADAVNDSLQQSGYYRD